MHIIAESHQMAGFEPWRKLRHRHAGQAHMQCNSGLISEAMCNAIPVVSKTIEQCIKLTFMTPLP